MNDASGTCANTSTTAKPGSSRSARSRAERIPAADDRDREPAGEPSQRRSALFRDPLPPRRERARGRSRANGNDAPRVRARGRPCGAADDAGEPARAVAAARNARARRRPAGRRRAALRVLRRLRRLLRDELRLQAHGRARERDRARLRCVREPDRDAPPGRRRRRGLDVRRLRVRDEPHTRGRRQRLPAAGRTPLVRARGRSAERVPARGGRRRGESRARDALRLRRGRQRDERHRPARQRHAIPLQRAERGRPKAVPTALRIAVVPDRHAHLLRRERQRDAGRRREPERARHARRREPGDPHGAGLRDPERGPEGAARGRRGPVRDDRIRLRREPEPDARPQGRGLRRPPAREHCRDTLRRARPRLARAPRLGRPVAVDGPARLRRNGNVVARHEG